MCLPSILISVFDLQQIEHESRLDSNHFQLFCDLCCIVCIGTGNMAKRQITYTTCSGMEWINVAFEMINNNNNPNAYMGRMRYPGTRCVVCVWVWVWMRGWWCLVFRFANNHKINGTQQPADRYWYILPLKRYGRECFCKHVRMCSVVTAILRQEIKRCPRGRGREYKRERERGNWGEEGSEMCVNEQQQ